MILKSITPYNFGPFAVPTTLEIAPGVTVLTGPNDSGKTSILRLIEAAFSNKGIEEEEVNSDHLHVGSVPWQQDREIKCSATFQLISSNFRQYFDISRKAPALAPGYELDIEFGLAPEARYRKTAQVRDSNGDALPQTNPLKKPPRVLRLPLRYAINSVVNPKSANPRENELLILALGNNYAARLESYSPLTLTRELRSAGSRATDKLRQLLPASMNLQFAFDKIAGEDPLQLAINLVDKHDGYIPFHRRGAGVQKIITIITAMLSMKLGKEQTVVLFDEPENSLHADAQHTLRLFLEELATSETIQVIYATHSPSMVNTVQCDRLRLLERTNKDGKPTSVINNRPLGDNFQPIRSSLGISPADSLLYAPITIIVEGITEILCLPLLLIRLRDSGQSGFGQVDRLLSVSHFLNGQGASFEYWCRVAESQGCKPIIFVDEDRTRQIEQQKVREKHPEVPVISLEDGQEFEDLVQKSTYFRALGEIAGGEGITLEAFREWEETAGLPERMVFTKRVGRWLDDLHPDVFYDKAVVMRRAIELEDLSLIDLKKIGTLVKEISSLAQDL